MTSMGSQVAATRSKASLADARSSGSALQRSTVACTMFGMCGAGSSAGLP
eukprot:CAMPEP_0115341018 /NCGR_PEP_ID=MMETSP0270-20121206/91455_1 /TAXON_ID=71861 /ORGANISM="Scrippsiella trochoidea, Strain CCMP3099" /LENGTH=49 /DNA_ID= /DNA_START= /DNA_END= /DNA_ORIENTATION=